LQPLRLLGFASEAALPVHAERTGRRCGEEFHQALLNEEARVQEKIKTADIAREAGAGWPLRDPQLERQTWDALQRCLRTCEAALEARIRGESGLSLPRHLALTALAEAPEGLTMSELARALGVTNANVTALVDALERDGWAAREGAAGDRRKVVVRLSASARRTARTLNQTFALSLGELLSELPVPELRLLVNLLEKLRRNAEQAAERGQDRSRQLAGHGAGGPGMGWV